MRERERVRETEREREKEREGGRENGNIFPFVWFLRRVVVNHHFFPVFSFHLLTSPTLSPIHASFRLLLPSTLCVGNKTHWGRL